MPIVILFLLAFDLWYIIKVNKGDVWQVSGDVFSRHTTPDTRHLKKKFRHTNVINKLIVCLSQSGY